MVADNSLQNCQSVFPSRADLRDSSFAFLTSANVILTVLNIGVNIFLIYALSSTKQLKKISCRLIMYLSLSDICVGLLVQNPVTVLLTLFKKNSNCPLELTGQSTSYIFPQISGVMIMIIAIDRWLHMKFLNRYSSLMNKRRAHLMVLANVCLALLIAAASVLASLYDFFFIFNAILVVTDVSVVVVIYISYVSTFKSVRTQLASIRKRNKETNNRLESSSAEKSTLRKKPKKLDTELAKTMIFILTSLTVCYLPYFIVGLYWSYIRYQEKSKTGEALDTVLWCCFILVYLNSTLNAAIFIKRNKKAYGLLKNIFGFDNAAEVSNTMTDNSSAANHNTPL